MKTVLVLLLLCLSDPGHSDCQADCLSCTNVLPRRLAFNTMECLTQCEGDASSSSYLDFCHELLAAHVSSMSRKMQKRSKEEVEALFSKEEEEEEAGPLQGDLFIPVELQRFDHMTQALGVDERGLGGNQMNTGFQSRNTLNTGFQSQNTLNAGFQSQNTLSLEDKYEEEAEQEDGPSRLAAGGEGDYGLSLSKRFGGFVKGRHGYRKLISPGRSYQKRYGGFIGIRKSARKWNNQKRFSEFLKQYLGMSAHATEFNSVSEELAQQNHV